MSIRRVHGIVISAILCALAVAPAAHPQSPAAAGPAWMKVLEADPLGVQVDFATVWPRDYYFVYLYDANGGLERRKPYGTSEYTWRDLAPCTTYQVAASAVVDGVETALSPRDSFKTPGCSAGPGWLNVVDESASGAHVDFASLWPRDHYVAYLLNESGVELRRERSNGPIGNTSSHTWTDLAPCTTYKAAATAVVAGA